MIDNLPFYCLKFQTSHKNLIYVLLDSWFGVRLLVKFEVFFRTHLTHQFLDELVRIFWKFFLQFNHNTSLDREGTLLDPVSVKSKMYKLYKLYTKLINNVHIFYKLYIVISMYIIYRICNICIKCSTFLNSLA